jgi:uncharacterized protein (TIGR02679 family)
VNAPVGEVDLPRVRRLLGAEGLDWLVARVRERLERGHRVGETLRLVCPTPAQREALDALLGRAPRGGGSLTVRVGDLDDVVRRAGAAADLATAVVALTGALRDLAGTAAAEAAAWEGAHAPLSDLVAARPQLEPWVTRVRANGLLRRLSRGPSEAGRLAAEVVSVLEVLPLPDPRSRAQLAADVLRDAHALDDDRPLATLALGAAAALIGQEPGAGAAWRRRTWSSVGVRVGDLSAPVLTVGLPAQAGTTTGRALELWRAVGEPVHLTLRQLVSDPPQLRVANREVFVCENPAVVAAAADRHGAACQPLVCAHGQPSSAVTALLELVVSCGGRLRYHGDFDWGGVRIAGRVLALPGVTPWRFGFSDYQAAVAAGRHGRRLADGQHVETPWSRRLSERMRELALAVEEEAVLDDLLGDLG